MGVRMRYVFTTPSGESHMVECPVRDFMRHARYWSMRWNEAVDVFKCSSAAVAKEVYPEAQAAQPRTEIMKTRCQINSAIKRFKSLPKKGSFSGLHLSGEIERLQQHLDSLGDKGKRFYPEVTIEVG